MKEDKYHLEIGDGLSLFIVSLAISTLIIYFLQIYLFRPFYIFQTSISGKKERTIVNQQVAWLTSMGYGFLVATIIVVLYEVRRRHVV